LSWIQRSRFCVERATVIFDAMDTELTVSGNDEPPNSEPAAEHRQRSPAWTMGRLIELLDEAIDSVGAQLVRSAGLWADAASGDAIAQEPSQRPPRGRAAQREAVGPWSSTSESLVDDSRAGHEFDMP
jgi:hypothetical protein